MNPYTLIQASLEEGILCKHIWEKDGYDLASGFCNFKCVRCTYRVRTPIFKKARDGSRVPRKYTLTSPSGDQFTLVNDGKDPYIVR